MTMNCRIPAFRGKELAPTSSGRRRREFKVWEEVYSSTGRLHRIRQEIDRTNLSPDNWRYRKKVIDAQTGEILRHDDKPLREHQGHGSDKGRKNHG
jgi:hypothetical protein